jgi:serine/threonine protein kinase
MAPEHLRGEQAAPGHDEYSLGMTLYELLAGRSPLHDVLHDREELLRKQFREMPPPLAGVHGLPREIDEAVSRMIAKDPKERFGSMKRVAQELTARRAWLLAEWSARRIVHVIPPGEPTPPGDPLSRRDYLPPEPTPIHDPPSPFPSARVVVPESQPAGGPAAPVSTTPLGEHRGLSGTIPLDSDAATLLGPRSGRGTATLRAPPAAPAAGPREAAPPSLPRPSSPRWLPSDPVGRPQETPPAVTRPAQSTMGDTGPDARAGSAPARARRQVFWLFLMVAVVISSALSFGLVRWLGGAAVSGAAPIMPADAGAEAASAPQPKAKKSPK